MIAVTLLAVLLQTASVPLPLPPPADSLAAALALWADHPPAPAFLQQAIDRAIYIATERALYAAGIPAAAGNLENARRFIAKSDRLRPLIAGHMPTDRTAIDRAADACVVDRVAWRLSPAEIVEVRTFMATPVGSKFWRESAPGDASYDECYDRELMLVLRATDDDYRAAGIVPPRSNVPSPGSVIY